MTSTLSQRFIEDGAGTLGGGKKVLVFRVVDGESSGIYGRLPIGEKGFWACGLFICIFMP